MTSLTRTYFVSGVIGPSAVVDGRATGKIPTAKLDASTASIYNPVTLYLSERVLMAEQEKDNETADTESIDYNKSQTEVDKAKQKAADADAKRLREESE